MGELGVITVDVTGTDEFKNLIEIIKKFSEDEEVPKEVREKYLKEVKVLGNWGFLLYSKTSCGLKVCKG